MPRGRPSTYDPEEYPKLVIEMGKQGRTVTKMAATIGVNTSTLYRWTQTHSEFERALSLAKTFSQAYWEDLLHDIAAGINDVNRQQLTAIIYTMKSRFPEWQEKRTIEDNDKAVEQMTEKELKERFSKLTVLKMKDKT